MKDKEGYFIIINVKIKQKGIKIVIRMQIISKYIRQKLIELKVRNTSLQS